MPIGWDESLTTGMTEIDEQHKQLFAHFEQLLAACKEGKGRDELLNMLGFLNEYADYHFKTEEAYMAQQGYAGLEEQRRQHQQFRDKLGRLELQARCDGAGIDLVAKTNRMVLDWIIQHIRSEDKKMVRLLNADG